MRAGVKAAKRGTFSDYENFVFQMAKRNSSD